MYEQKSLQQRNIVIGILSIILTTIILILYNYLLFKFMHYEDRSTEFSKLFIFDPVTIMPEPLERFQYISSVVILPFLLFISIHYIYNIVNKFSKKVINRFYFSLSLIFICLLSLIIWLDSTESEFYYLNRGITIEGNNIKFYSITLLFIIIYLFLNLIKNQKFKQLFNIITFVLIIIYIAFLSGINIYTIYNIDDGYIFTNHFNAVFHSVALTFLNKLPLVSYMNQYGLYPLFLEPIFKLIGLSVINFTFVMALLIFFSFFLIFKTLKEILNNFLAFIGFSSVLYYGYIFMRISQDPYFQYYPIRSLFPSILIYFSVSYFKQKSKIKYYFSFILFSLAILWNLDTGLIVFITWLLVLIFSEVLEKRPLKEVLFSSTKHFIFSVITFISVLAIYSAYVYIRVNELPDLIFFLQYQKYFYGFGFFMLPMPIFHPWNSIILIYIIGLFISLFAAYKRDNKLIVKVIFLLSILGLGLFSYYQGRSHNAVLPYCSYPALMLIPIFTQKMYNFIIEKQQKFLIKLPIIILSLSCVIYMCYSFTNLMYSSSNLLKSFKTRMEITMHSQNTPLINNIHFIKENVVKKEKTLILSYHSGINYLMTDTLPAIDLPGFSEILLIEDYERICNFIKQKEIEHIFLDSTLLSRNQEFNFKIITVLFENYDLSKLSNDKSVQMFVRKESENKSIGTSNYMSNIKNSTHNKRIINNLYYNSNTRIWTNPFNMGATNFENTFSIQVSLQPEKVQKPYAIIVGNHPGTGHDGFVIQQDYDKNNEYSFIYGDGTKWSEPLQFKLKENEVSYLVIQYISGVVKLYINGNLIITTKSTLVYKNSTMPLTLGNWMQGDRPFTGNIDEIQIAPELISDEEIRDNWITIINNSKN